MKKTRYVNLDMFRLVCAVLVVAIHVNRFNVPLDSFEFGMIQILPRIAVPFFFAVSGTFFFGREKAPAGKEVMRYAAKLLGIYLAWGAVYYLIRLYRAPQVYLNPVTFASSLLFDGLEYHFWYFPALIYSVLMAWVIWRWMGKNVVLIVSILLYGIAVIGNCFPFLFDQYGATYGLLTSGWFFLFRRIFGMGFAFFSAGILINKLNAMTLNAVNKAIGKWRVLLITSIALWISEIVLILRSYPSASIVITFGLYVMTVCAIVYLMQEKPLCAPSQAKKFRYYANVIFYIHPMILEVLICLPLFSGAIELSISRLFLLWITCSLISFGIGYALFHWNRQWINRIIG